jgi:hypothetical protein
MWIAVALLAAWLIRRWPRLLIAAVLLLSVPSPLLVSAWTALNREVVLGWSEVTAADWIAANTPERAVFVTNGWLNSPTDPAGRLRVLTFTPYIANLGYSPDERYALVDRIYCNGDPGESAALADSLGASYLLDVGPPRQCAPTVFEGSPDWELAYDAGGVRIWHLAGGSVSFRR